MIIADRLRLPLAPITCMAEMNRYELRFWAIWSTMGNDDDG